MAKVDGFIRPAPAEMDPPTRARVDLAPWRGVASRPFAPSLERLRLQTYALMAICDLAIIMISFMISGAIRSDNFLLPTAIRQALLLMPMFGVLAMYNRTYSAQALTRISFAVSRVISAIILATGLLLFVTFYAKVTEDFSRIAFTIGTTLSIALMSALRVIIVRCVRANWGPRRAERAGDRRWRTESVYAPCLSSGRTRQHARHRRR